ncbi:PREDICTED: protein POOR HOMOLOGOUS SYNAPSIS 1 [Ipomoea nil]|uniref:protein POOR HOMOLOGOUS SYNAPSIS 1 n=1 Tax=Ipomoea nil TaxID=35883 RepID=UPI0009011867|nr:PREDICTED: protein POOR HOMOLOGOUS SYNAPSIS 1 [Ipomoea nil]
MAGIMEGVATEQPLSSKAYTAVTDRWEVQYARFVMFPSSPHASHPSLVPHSARQRKVRRGGKWISTSSSNSTAVSLKLLTVHDADFPDQILVLSLGHKILEEHYISRLHFAWPQVSCVSGFPTRGARSVFVSYKDRAGQVQKFALRFSIINEIEKFMIDVKENLEGIRPISLPCPPVDSTISSQSEFIPSDEASHRDNNEIQHTTSADTGTYEIPANISNEVSQDSSSQEMRLNREAEEILSSFPPSFTSFLMNCGPAVEQAQPTLSNDINLKAQIMKCLEDSSFQDMLIKVEKVINGVGDFNMML